MPKDIDLVDYDRYLFQKQLDMEIMRIRFDAAQQKREVSREKNEIGMFKRLHSELHSVAQQYGKDIEDIYQLWEDVNCSKAQLKSVLEGQSYAKWTVLEDLALKGGDRQQLRYLEKTKGTEQMEKRAKFLGIAM